MKALFDKDVSNVSIYHHQFIPLEWPFLLIILLFPDDARKNRFVSFIIDLNWTKLNWIKLSWMMIWYQLNVVKLRWIEFLNNLKSRIKLLYLIAGINSENKQILNARKNRQTVDLWQQQQQQPQQHIKWWNDEHMNELTCKRTKE